MPKDADSNALLTLPFGSVALERSGLAPLERRCASALGSSRGRKRLPLEQNQPVPKEGLEPSRPFGRRILNPLRLPFRHFGLRARLRLPKPECATALRA